MHIEWYHYLLVIGVGFIAGFINTLAGSGSLLTLPLLMFLGLPANVANGTNRIGILMQSVVAVTTFKRRNVLEIKNSSPFIIPAIIGAIVGANIAISFDDAVMKKIIGALLIILVFTIFLSPSKWMDQKGNTKLSNKILIPIFFLIGVYGGFIQAGVGFFLLTGLVLGAGIDLVKANALKLLIVLLYTPVALVVYIIHNQVDYKLGLILAAGNMLGAYIASLLAIRKGARFIRLFLVLALIASSFKLLGLF